MRPNAHCSRKEKKVALEKVISMYLLGGLQLKLATLLILELF